MRIDDAKDATSRIVVGRAETLPVGAARRVPSTPDTAAIAVFNVDGEFHAVDDTCTHQDASLADGWLDGCFIECPLHSSLFDLRTGEPTEPPARRPVRVHRVYVVDGLIVVEAQAGA
jgi:3-phenylpropionate/trans-cinnamate dioxygenase ferredoxin component